MQTRGTNNGARIYYGLLITFVIGFGGFLLWVRGEACEEDARLRAEIQAVRTEVATELKALRQESEITRHTVVRMETLLQERTQRRGKD